MRENCVRSRSLYILAFLLSIGCSNGEGVQWSGNVSLDDAPLANGTIRFEPSDGAGPSVGTEIIDGAYSVRLAEGSKVVEIRGWRVVRTVDLTEYESLQPGQSVEPAVEGLIEHTETVEVRGPETRDFRLTSE